MHCIVVGAGLLGLTTAHFLKSCGAEVSVVERAPGPGLETSFANGGMLHASQANPWNEPGVLWQAVRTLGHEDAALLVRPGAMMRMLPWAWQFFRNASPRRYRDNLARNARLAGYSLRLLDDCFTPLSSAFQRADLGTLKIYRSEEELAAALKMARVCDEWDVRYDVLDPRGVAALEPALAPIESRLGGGIHFPGDVSGDAHLFCRALAGQLQASGVRFHFETAVEHVRLLGGRFSAVEAGGELLAGDACVIAAGSHSRSILRPLGLAVPVEPVKGYSLTIPIESGAPTPHLPVIDEHYHAAVCPLGAQLRVAGTAEFAGFDDRLTASRIENLYRLLDAVYPEVRVERSRVVEWCGLRPMSPDGVGLMGPSRIPGIHLNTGHGHLGWTMAPAAGKLVADQVLGLACELPGGDYSPARFGC